MLERWWNFGERGGKKEVESGKETGIKKVTRFLFTGGRFNLPFRAERIGD